MENCSGWDLFWYKHDTGRFYFLFVMLSVYPAVPIVNACGCNYAHLAITSVSNFYRSY